MTRGGDAGRSRALLSSTSRPSRICRLNGIALDGRAAVVYSSCHLARGREASRPCPCRGRANAAAPKPATDILPDAIGHWRELVPHHMPPPTRPPGAGDAGNNRRAPVRLTKGKKDPCFAEPFLYPSRLLAQCRTSPCRTRIRFGSGSGLQIRPKKACRMLETGENGRAQARARPRGQGYMGNCGFTWEFPPWITPAGSRS